MLFNLIDLKKSVQLPCFKNLVDMPAYGPKSKHCFPLMVLKSRCGVDMGGDPTLGLPYTLEKCFATTSWLSQINHSPETGKPAKTILNRTPLQQIAAETDGQYFEISDEVSEIGDLTGELERLEGGVTGSRVVEASANKYFYFLLVALALALLDMILPLKAIKL